MTNGSPRISQVLSSLLERNLPAIKGNRMKEVKYIEEM